MFRQYRLFRRLIRLYERRVPNSVNCLISKELVKVNLLIASQICCTSIVSMGLSDNAKLEDDITKALQEGNSAIIRLMNQLKDFVVAASNEYRNCLLKQIEIMQKGMDSGPFSETWDELPRYRTLANELQKELIEYCTLFKTLDALARTKSEMCAGSGEAENVLDAFKAIENLIQKEVERNKRVEKELLKTVTDTIVNEVQQEEAGPDNP